jgi:hypothetical protein
MTAFPFALSPSALLRRALSKGTSERAQGFDKPVLSKVEGLGPNGD